MTIMVISPRGSTGEREVDAEERGDASWSTPARAVRLTAARGASMIAVFAP